MATYEELRDESKKATTLRYLRLVHYAQQFGEKILYRQPQVPQLAVWVGGELVPQVQDNTGTLQNTLHDRIAAMQDRVRISMGVSLPQIKTRTSGSVLKSGEYMILLDEVPLQMGTLLQDKYLYPGPRPGPISG